MNEQILWSIGSLDGRSPDLVDTYKQPTLLGDVVWCVPRDGQPAQQRWPLFHPSQADPDAGYRLHPYTIEFWLEQAPGLPISEAIADVLLGHNQRAKTSA